MVTSLEVLETKLDAILRQIEALQTRVTEIQHETAEHRRKGKHTAVLCKFWLFWGHGLPVVFSLN